MERVTADLAERFTDPAGGPLTRSAAAAITALARSLEVFDPPAARRAALRAHLANRIGTAAGIPIQDRVDAITGSILAEIGILLSHVRPIGTGDIAPDPGSAVLSASVLGRLPGLGGTAQTVRHQFERWDGSGGPHGLSGPDIPIAARLVALAASLIGYPHHSAAPNWTAGRRRVEEELGTVLDPDIGAAAVLDMESGEALPSDVLLDEILHSLESYIPPERDSPVDALVSIGAAVRAIDRMPDVLLVIAEQAKRALHADAITIGRLDHANASFVALVNAEDSEYLERFPVSELHNVDDRPGLDQIFDGSGFVISVNEGRADDPGVISLHSRGLRSEAAWPIIMGESIWGVVWATTRAGAAVLDHDDLSTLRLVATHVAAAVTQAERIAEFEELALRDPLTGLSNRRVLDERLTDVFSRPAIERQDVALLMCDVDGLKLVNDSGGHSAGDELLVEAGRALSTAAATVDNSITCRVGGDEFCIVLDGGGMLSAEPVAEMAQRLFAETGADRSLSCGIAMATPDITGASQLLRAADEAQYEEKRQRKGLPSLDPRLDTTERRLTRRSD